MYERKYVDAGSLDLGIEIKADTEERTLEGLASVTNNKDLGGDLIEQGAFEKAIKKYGTSLVHLKNHDSDLLFARTIELEETAKGLRFKSSVAPR